MDTVGAVLLGNETPTYEWVPEAWSSAGQDAVGMARASGIDMDGWQDHILDGGLGEDRHGQWVANEVGVIVGRQNGKGGIIEARELSGLFVFGETYILHSAHLQNTSNDAFRRMKVIIQSNPDLDRRLMRISHSKGDEGFEFRINGRTARLRYMSRTGGASRGFTDVQLVILDEAMILDDAPIAAMLPTMATQSSWQVWYMGSAGDRRLRTESVVMARVRRRGLRREPGMCLYMWEAHLRHTPECKPECRVDVRSDPRTWAKTNPSMNRKRRRGSQGVQESFLRKMMGSMAAWDFDREFLGVGDYPTEEGWSIFGKDAWNGLKDENAVNAGRPPRFAVGLASTWDGERSSVSIMGKRPDELFHLEMIENRPGITWMVDYAVALKKKRPVTFVVHPNGPAAVVIQDLENAKVPVYKPKAGEFAQWCGKMTQLVIKDRTLRHLNQSTMNTAVAVVKKKDVGQGLYVWDGEDTSADVSPWFAGTLALGGLLVKGRRRKPLTSSVLAGAIQTKGKWDYERGQPAES